MVYNIVRETFYNNLKNGDLVGTMNVIEHLRKINNNNAIKFYVENAIHNKQYNVDFYNFLLNNTDYFSKFPGEQTLPWKNVSLWDYRTISGDLIKISNVVEMTKKIVVFPIFDALYNQYRNWPLDVFKNIIEQYSASEYDNYEKIICVKEDLINLSFEKWKGMAWQRVGEYARSAWAFHTSVR
jgi:hypothetical protein